MFSLAFVEKVKERIDKFYDTCDGNGLVVIWGATATGKTGLSVQLSQYYPLSVISSDSRQIFRYMDIGTDKVSSDVRENVPHYQIDIVDPNESYTAGQRKTDSESHISNIISEGRLPFIVGGTGLYVDTIYKNFEMPGVSPNMTFRDSLYEQEDKDPGILWKMLNQIDPDEASIHHPNSVRYIIRALEIHDQTGRIKSSFMKRREPKWPLLMLGLWRDKEDTNSKINARIKEMLAGGLIEETEMLLNKGYGPELQSMQGIGYKQTVEYLCEHRDLDILGMDIRRATHRLAKKQRSRFRRYISDSHIGFPNVTYKVYDLS